MSYESRLLFDRLTNPTNFNSINVSLHTSLFSNVELVTRIMTIFSSYLQAHIKLRNPFVDTTSETRKVKVEIDLVKPNRNRLRHFYGTQQVSVKSVEIESRYPNVEKENVTKKMGSLIPGRGKIVV